MLYIRDGIVRKYVTLVVGGCVLRPRHGGKRELPEDVREPTNSGRSLLQRGPTQKMHAGLRERSLRGAS